MALISALRLWLTIRLRRWQPARKSDINVSLISRPSSAIRDLREINISLENNDAALSARALLLAVYGRSRLLGELKIERSDRARIRLWR